jgi:hypothetical protein
LETATWGLFLLRRSASINLLKTFNDWTLAIHNKNSICVVYIDTAKSFDTANHKQAKIFCFGLQAIFSNTSKDF